MNYLINQTNKRMRPLGAAMAVILCMMTGATFGQTLTVVPDPASFSVPTFPYFTNVTVQRSAPFISAETVNFVSSNTNVFDIQPPGSVTFDAGVTSSVLFIRLRSVGSAQLVSVSTNRTVVSTTVTVIPPLSLQASPVPVTIALNVNPTTTLTVSRRSAAAGGLNTNVTVTIISAQPSIAAPIPGVLNFPATMGTNQSINLMVTGLVAGATTFQISAPGYPPIDVPVNVVVNPTYELLFVPDAANIVLSAGGTTTVSVIRQASVAGVLNSNLTVTLSSSDPSVFTAPVTINFAPSVGSSQATSVVITGVSPGTATLSATAGGYLPGEMEVNVYSNTFLIVYGQPDPLDIIRNVSDVRFLEVIREGLLPGDLTNALDVGLFSLNPGVMVPLVDSVAFASTMAVSQTNVVPVLGVSQGSATLFLAPTDPAYTPQHVAVNVFDSASLSLPVNLFVTVGGVADIALTRFSGLTDPLTVIITAAGASNVSVRGNGATFTSSDLLTIPAGVNQAVFQVRGNFITSPGSVPVYALAAGFNSASMDVFVTDGADSDGDGLPDSWEIAYGLNPFSAIGVNGASGDPDFDGLANIQEYQLGTNPKVADTNGNGTSDYEEDTDGDGVADGDEFNVIFTNPFVPDSDSNGISDFDEDFDNDNLSNGIELYCTGTNPLQADSDNNGIPDGEEDSDGDGLANAMEILLGTSPCNPDSNGNGIPDGLEDSDGDGLSNASEINLYNTDPNNPDSDDDGVSDGIEVTNVTSPLHPMSVFDLDTKFNNRARQRSLDLGAILPPGSGVIVPSITNRFVFNPTEGWTIEAWVYLTSDLSGEILSIDSATGDDITFAVTNGAPIGFIRNSLGSTVVTAGGLGISPLITSRWAHVSLSWSPSDNSLRLFRDGLLLIAQQSLYQMNMSTGTVRMGHGFTAGYLDEVRVWKRARTGAEISTWFQRIYPAPGSVSVGVDGAIPAQTSASFVDLFYNVLAYDRLVLPFYRPVYEFGQPLVAYYRFDDGGNRVEDFAFLNNTNFQFAAPVTTVQAANPIGEDDADGDGLPDWWVEIHDLNRFLDVQEGPYHVLQRGKSSDYPLSFMRGWDTADGTPGRNNRIYYTTRTEIAGGQQVTYYNVWQDNAPELVDSNGAPVQADVYSGRGVYDQTGGPYDDTPIFFDTVWFTVNGTFGQNNAYYNDKNGNGQFNFGEDIWVDRGGENARGGVYDLQSIVGIWYYRTFLSYGSLGGRTAWFENNRYITTKDSSVNSDGAFSSFFKYIYLQNPVQLVDMTLKIFAVNRFELYVNGSNYQFVADAQGKNTLDPAYTNLSKLLRLGRNAIYLKTDNTVTEILDEGNVHYRSGFGREIFSMKFDLDLTVNGEPIIVRGDNSVADPRAAWYGNAWSTFTDNEIAPNVRPLPDIDNIGQLNPDHGIPNDPDADRLNNHYEVLVNTNPRDQDSNNNGISDGEEDYDVDGLINIDEANFGSDPRLPDTDDDGVIDGLEASGGIASALIPNINRVLRVNGTVGQYLELPVSSRFALPEFTVELWVKPDAGYAGNGILIRRSLASGRDNFVLSLDGNLRPTIGYNNGASVVTLTGGLPIPADGSTWTHIAATFENSNQRRELRLYVNGALAGFQRPSIAPATTGGGPLIQRVGESFRGRIDEVRVWNIPRSASAIGLSYQSPVSGLESGLVAYYKFDDSTNPAGTSGLSTLRYGQAQDFVLFLAADWTRRWLNAATLIGGAVMTVETNSPISVGVGADSDNDELPDLWELQYFGNLDQTGFDDYDNDGLNNLYEYLAGTDPTSPDTDGNGVLDYYEDADGDSLSNGEEQDLYRTHPGRADSDDDNMRDGDEVLAGTNPLLSLSAYIPKSLEFLPGGAGKVEIADDPENLQTGRYDIATFTFELWVMPSNLPPNNVRQPLLSREVKIGGVSRISHEVGLLGAFPYVRFQTQGGLSVEALSGTAVSRGAWSHLAARFSSNNLAVLINGVSVRSVNTGLQPARGIGNLVLGGQPGFVGQMRDIRVWKVGRTDTEINQNRDLSLYFNDQTVSPFVLRTIGDEGHLRYNDLSGATELTTWTVEAWVKTESAAGDIVNRWNTSAPGEGDFNYFMRLDGQGRIQAGFAGQFTKITEENDGSNITFKTEVVVDTSSRNHIQGALRINDGLWHHVAYTRSATSASLYIDGLLDSTLDGYLYPIPGANEQNFDGRPRALTGPLVVGRSVLGNIDEVRVWNRALSQSEINNNRLANLIGSEPGLVAYFGFDNPNSSLQVVNRASLFATPPRIGDVGILAPSASLTAGKIDVSATGENFILVPFRVLGGISLVSFFSADDGGITLEDHIRENRFEYAGVLNQFVRFGLRNIDPDRDSDGDGLPDWWETLYGLNPYDPSGINGPWGDADNDGLGNLAEYQAGLNPRDVDSDGDGISDYDEIGRNGSTWGLMFDDVDGMDNAWETLYPGWLSPQIDDARSDRDGDGWSAYAEFLFSGIVDGVLINRTRPDDRTSYPKPMMNLAINYDGLAGVGPVVIHAFSSSKMDGNPDATLSVPAPSLYPAIVRTNTFTTGYLREGAAWFFAFMDLDGNGQWSDGEPAGLADRQPIHVGWGEVYDVSIGLTDALAGYPRFSWAPVGGRSSSTVTITRITSPGAPIVFSRVVRARNYIHEGDLMDAGQYGLNTGGSLYPGYRWFVNGQASNFAFSWPSSLAAPVVIQPKDQILRFAANEMIWQMPELVTAYDVEIYEAASGKLVVRRQMVPVPYRYRDGTYRAPLPVLAGDSMMPNGSYTLRLRCRNPHQQSAFSALTPFSVGLTNGIPDAYSIGGDVIYAGFVPYKHIILEAYRSSGFSGIPSARTRINQHGPFRLQGMPKGTYHVRAFIDLNENDKYDDFEPYGLIREASIFSANDLPKPITIPQNALGQKLLLRDKDVNNNGLSDAYEFVYGSSGYYQPFDYDLGYHIAVYEQKTGDWYVRKNGGMVAMKQPFGWSATIPVPGDYDGDGLRDVAVYHPSAAQWYILQSASKSVLQFQFGWSEVESVPADYDGDGKTDIAVIHPQTATWYIRRSSNQSVLIQQFGWQGVRAVPADYDGDGKDDIAIYHALSSTWYILNSSSGTLTVRSFGPSQGLPVPADYDGDGRSDLAVFQQSSAVWHILLSSSQTTMQQQFGWSAVNPVPSDYDGDGKTDVAVFYPASGQWFIRYSSGAFEQVQWGGPHSVPVSSDAGLMLKRKP